MRSPLLALLPLAFAVALAPIAPVRVIIKKAAEEKSGEESERDAHTAPSHEKHEGNGERAGDEKEEQKRAPARTQWCELTPVLATGGDGPVDDGVEPGVCPELSPALYARRLPAAPRIAEPSSEPDRVSLKAGHLSLPPPVA